MLKRALLLLCAWSCVAACEDAVVNPPPLYDAAPEPVETEVDPATMDAAGPPPMLDSGMQPLPPMDAGPMMMDAGDDTDAGADGAAGSEVTWQCPDCSLTGEVCDPTTFTCVECVPGNEQTCTDQDNVCDPERNVCVECADGNSQVCTAKDMVCDGARYTCVECVDGNDVICAGKGMVCDTANSVCVECVQDNTQVCEAQGLVCQTGTTSCIECNEGSDCLSGSCLADGTCEGCEGDDECGDGYCLDFECKECRNDGDCTDGVCEANVCVQCRPGGDQCQGERDVCHPAQLRCVECVGNVDCDPDAPVCDSNACVACDDHEDCDVYDLTAPACVAGRCEQCAFGEDQLCGTGLYCETQNTHQCQQCAIDDHCPSTAPVCNGQYECSGCTERADCATLHPSTPACDATSGSCVQCTPGDDEAACGGDSPRCAPTMTCEQCVTDAHCSQGEPVCSDQFECVGCARRADCQTLYPSTPACDTVGGGCVECVPNGDQGACGSTQQCAPTFTCEECVTDSHCTQSEPVCSNAYECGGCSARSDCAPFYPATPACNSVSGGCVECVPGEDEAACSGDTSECAPTFTCEQCAGDDDCTVGEPVCSNQYECEGCGSRADCQSLYPATPACDTDSGGCVECVPGEDEAACSGDTPRCAPTRTCEECVTDGHCNRSEPVCTNQYECGGCNGRSDCQGLYPATPACDTDSGSCVECVPGDDELACGNGQRCAPTFTCEECVTDEDCSAEAPVCSSAFECVACAEGGDCSTLYPDTPACDPDSGGCVECVAGEDTAACASDEACAPTRTCEECVADADCTASEPVCSNEYLCGGCTARGDCATLYPGTPACATDTGSCVECVPDQDEAACGTDEVCLQGGNVCVECNGDDDCTSADAARCVNNACVPCTADAQCATVGGGLDVCFAGDCVDCRMDPQDPSQLEDSKRELGCSGTFSCDPGSNACTATPQGSVDNCLPCVSDSQCAAEHRCVQLSFLGTNQQGGRCMKVASTGCQPPFRNMATPRTSFSGAPIDEYCGVREDLTTCEAVLAFPGGCSSPTDCAPQGALCNTVGGVSNRCTYACVNELDCPDGEACESGYCGG